ncbi:MAG: DUF2085 domain-containing protein [Chloroflexi bacterium]|nr:DUF2085 domain-containing protein [Chloroflexota bacterium]
MRRPAWGWIAVGAIVLAAWLYFTPPGLLGKADAIAYAVCARDPSHSPFLGNRQMPLCYRCTGMHLATLLTLAVLAWRAPRRGGYPRGLAAWVLGGLFLAFALDGTNAFVSDFLHHPWLYTPNNILRLFTGLGMGIVIGAMLYAVAQQAMWANSHPEPALTNRRLAALLLAAAALGGLVLTNNPLVLYPVALLTTADVVGLLSAIYALFALGLTRREGQAHTWGELTDVFFVGWVIAMIQLSLMAWLRFSLTHTWGPYPKI